MIDLPNYEPEAVRPMRRELVDVGFDELFSADDVERAMSEESSGVKLFMVNSVCGCAAGFARPGVAMALQHERIPDRIYTVFAGMEKAAVRKLRKYLEPNPPSSPCAALIKDGKLVYFLPRMEIENASADQVAEMLIKAFDEHCGKQGPSIPRDEFDGLEFIRRCGSRLPRFSGAQ